MELCNQALEQSALDRGIVDLGNLERFARVFARAEQGEPITVGFLGGSITQDSAATRHENCYAYRTYLWWKRQFPKSEVRYVNAGIGATTSQFGVARVEADLLSKGPDVVFCEFSVNDADTPFYRECFEGLLRKILSDAKEPALLVFNNVVYDTGENAQAAHNAVALHYGLPVVSMKDSIYEEIQLGNLAREEITADNLHPNDLGHGLVAQVLENCLALIYEKYRERDASVLTPWTLRQPLTQNRYENSRRIQGRAGLAVCEGFAEDPREQQGVRDVFKNGFTAEREGAVLAYRVNARKVSVQYRKTIAHPAPRAEVLIDGTRVAELVSDFDETWGDCLYLQDVWEAEEAAEHLVTVRITEVPKQPGAPFYFVSLICC